MGSFVQFSVNSVISSPNVTVRDCLEGVENYGASLVELEPEFQPEIEPQRRKLLDDEKSFITYFEYANFPGYSIVHVSDAGIDIDIYTGDSGKVWKSIALSSVINN